MTHAKNVRLHLSLYPETIRAARRLAAERGISLSRLCEILIDSYRPRKRATRRKAQ
jgi:hypothetical protein